MADVQFIVFEIQQPHNFIESVIARLHKFLGLLVVEVDDVVFVGKDVPCHYIEECLVLGEFHKTFYRHLANHTQIFPNGYAVGGQEDWSRDLAGIFRGENFEYNRVVTEL